MANKTGNNTKALTAKEKCPKFNNCEATLCPLDPDDHSWFPDEATCSRRNSETFIVPQWLITQRKIDQENK